MLPDTDYELSLVAKDEAGNEADPITITFRTAAAPAPAPTPDFTKKEVAVVFCDVEAGPAFNIGGWGQSTIVARGQLAAGDNVIYCTNMNYLGWELITSVNATGMEKLHVDFYTTSLTSVQLTPISPGHEGIYQAALTANEWNSIDIDLSVYAAAGIDWSNIFQFKFMEAAPAGGDLFIDNVYFYTEDTEGIENIKTVAPATKEIKNGVIYIIRDGIRYTITGQVVR